MQVTEGGGLGTVVFHGIVIENRNIRALISHSKVSQCQIPVSHLIVHHRNIQKSQESVGSDWVLGNIWSTARTVLKHNLLYHLISLNKTNFTNLSEWHIEETNQYQVSLNLRGNVY
ncbi:hypothetical protein ATANTOWER_017520 [Ataeniobius toweri]|uniref:Uncharacterized protein n=1 Tax=Ataeniobius toweri TaxID=208326 RepID=A0ABU7BHU8_9TELE|nr:hypothetical protein [Ataeniobius toweri]